MKSGRLSQMGQGGLGQVVGFTSKDGKREWEVGIGKTGGNGIRTGWQVDMGMHCTQYTLQINMLLI